MSNKNEKLKAKTIHCHFGLTYASYLVLPRSILQSMPNEWQNELVKLLEELDRTGIETPKYKVHAVDNNGKVTHDQYRDYQKGRRVIEFPNSIK